MGGCHRHSSMSSALTGRGVMLVVGSLPFQCQGLLRFLCVHLHTKACSLPPAPREGVKAAPQLPNTPGAICPAGTAWGCQPLPWRHSQSWSSDRLGNGHLATGRLVNPVQPCSGQGQPSHPLRSGLQSSEHKACGISQLMTKLHLLGLDVKKNAPV